MTSNNCQSFIVRFAFGCVLMFFIHVMTPNRVLS